MALDGIVTAVVVGQQKPLGGNQLARTAAVEKHHGVFHRSLVDRIDVVGRKAESFGAHVADAVRNQARKPHPLVGRGGREQQERKKGQQNTFHGFNVGR